MVTEIVDLDLGSNSSFKIVTMEGDICSRFIEFHLSYNGEVFNLQNKSVKCRYVNGKTTEEVNLVINDSVNGVCTLEIPYRITSIVQNGKCELVISQSGEILSTIPFGVEVVKSLVERATVESSNEFGALTNALWGIDGVNAKLNNINSQLNNKANYEYVNNQISIAQLEGASIDTTSFLTRSDLDYLLIKSINKFNPAKLTKDKYLVRGVLTDYVGWNTTEFIRVQGTTMSCKVFKTSDMRWVEVNNIYFAFYDSLYRYITGGSADTGSYLNQVPIPENAKFIRFSQSNKLLNDTSSLMFAFSDLSDLKTIDDYQKYCIELEGSDYIREEEFNQSIENVNKNIESVNINIKNVKDALSRSVTVKSINRLGYDVYNPLTPPEHSLEGYTLALEKGFDEILCDLRSTSDSYPICLHDTTINRTARNTDGTRLPTTNILDITYKQANSYDYGLYKNKKYKGTKLLTLERAVKFAKMNGVTLHIETKCGTSEVELKMIENAVRTVKKYNMSKFVSWSATYGKIAVLQKIISLDKYANVAIMPDVMTNERFEALLKLKTGFNKVFWFAWETSTIDDDMLNRFINNEVGLEIGTLNDCNEMKKLFDSNLRYVTAISSDKLVARECLK